jgi:cytochrome c553
MKKVVAAVAVVGAVVAFGATDCTACHKDGGMATPLNKLTPAEIVQKMKEYKAGKGNPMMVNIAKQMSDEEIKKVAKEYGKKK